jgi:hypothetical protein
VEAEYRRAGAPQETLSCYAAVLLDSAAPDTPGGVTASWNQLFGSNGLVAYAYSASEAMSLTELLTSVTISDSDGIVRKSAGYRGAVLETLLEQQLAATLAKGTCRLTVTLADAAGNEAPSSRTATFAVR